jgi:23S rRNA (adenine2030-N6)-methyltransferase
MNYRHAFHAGNFADVHKHILLLALLEHLHKKPAPFFVLDTHAGRGRYDLQSEAAMRSGEWHGGIGRLRNVESLPQEISRFVARCSTVQTYSGSPLLIASMLRENDRAVFIDAQTDELIALKLALGRQRHVSILQQDGYEALKAYLPPKENRGLVFIDPPYESDSELKDIAAAIRNAYDRWPNGTYCAWYPIKSAAAELRLHASLVDAHIKKMLLLELSIRQKDSPLGLNGSGLLIVNPPWQFEELARPTLTELHRILAPSGAGGIRIERLAGE